MEKKARKAVDRFLERIQQFSCSGEQVAKADAGGGTEQDQACKFIQLKQSTDKDHLPKITVAFV